MKLVRLVTSSTILVELLLDLKGPPPDWIVGEVGCSCGDSMSTQAGPGVLNGSLFALLLTAIRCTAAMQGSGHGRGERRVESLN